MDKNNKKAINWFLVAAICYYISAIVFFVSRENTNLAVTNLCLGSCFFCLSLSKSSKDK